MKMKTSELTGAALDWAVAHAQGKVLRLTERNDWHVMLTDGVTAVRLKKFVPSTNWAQGGPIIEREKIELQSWPEGTWLARSVAPPTLWNRGPTPLIAAMRCYVASKLGDEIEIPEELL